MEMLKTIVLSIQWRVVSGFRGKDEHKALCKCIINETVMLRSLLLHSFFFNKSNTIHHFDR